MTAIARFQNRRETPSPARAARTPAQPTFPGPSAGGRCPCAWEERPPCTPGQRTTSRPAWGYDFPPPPSGTPPSPAPTGTVGHYKNNGGADRPHRRDHAPRHRPHAGSGSGQGTAASPGTASTGSNKGGTNIFPPRFPRGRRDCVCPALRRPGLHQRGD